MSLEKSHIVVGALSGSVYIATGKEKDGRFVASSKVERSSEFMEAMIQWCGPGFEREIVLPDGKIVTVSMTEKTAAQQGTATRTTSRPHLHNCLAIPD